MHLDKGQIVEQYKEGKFKFIGVSTIDLYNSDPDLFGVFASGGIATYWSFLVYDNVTNAPIFSVACERSLRGQFIVAHDANYRYNLFQVAEKTPITSYDDFKPIALEAFEIFKQGTLKNKCASRTSRNGEIELFA